METIRFYFDILRNWWALLLVGTLVGAVGAYVYSSQMEPTYRTNLLMVVDQVEDPVATRYQDVQMNETLTDTYAARITSRPVLQAIINDLGLSMGVGELESMINARPVLNTSLIRVSVTDSDPARAMEIANALPHVFNEHDRALQSTQFLELRSQYSEQLDVINSDIANTQEEIRQLGNPSTPADEDRLEQLQANLHAYRSTYALLLEKHGELRLAEAARQPQLLVDEPASLSNNPVGPKTQRNTMIGGVAGFILVMFAATGLTYLSPEAADGVRSLRPFGSPAPAGATTAGYRPNANGTEIPTISLRTPHSGIEPSRLLIRDMIERHTDAAPCYLFADAGRAEIAGSVTAAVARTLAAAGQSTVVVDFDPTNPTLRSEFNVRQHNGVGHELDQLALDGQVSVDRLLLSTASPNLRVMPGVDSMTSDALDATRIGRLLDTIRGASDVVLVKGPHLHSASMTVALARQCDKTVLVMDSDAPSPDGVADDLATLRAEKITILAVLTTTLDSRFDHTPVVAPEA